MASVLDRKHEETIHAAFLFGPDHVQARWLENVVSRGLITEPCTSISTAHAVPGTTSQPVTSRDRVEEIVFRPLRGVAQDVGLMSALLFFKPT